MNLPSHCHLNIFTEKQHFKKQSERNGRKPVTYINRHTSQPTILFTSWLSQLQLDSKMNKPIFLILCFLSIRLLCLWEPMGQDLFVRLVHIHSYALCATSPGKLPSEKAPDETYLLLYSCHKRENNQVETLSSISLLLQLPICTKCCGQLLGTCLGFVFVLFCR